MGYYYARPQPSLRLIEAKGWLPFIFSQCPLLLPLLCPSPCGAFAVKLATRVVHESSKYDMIKSLNIMAHSENITGWSHKYIDVGLPEQIV